MKSESSASLRILGRPGTGKTTVAGFIIGHFLQQSLQTTLYFFCKADEIEKREPLYVLRTLLSQLLHSQPSLYANVEAEYFRSGRAVADSYVDGQ